MMNSKECKLTPEKQAALSAVQELSYPSFWDSGYGPEFTASMQFLMQNHFCQVSGIYISELKANTSILHDPLEFLAQNSNPVKKLFLDGATLSSRDVQLLADALKGELKLEELSLYGYGRGSGDKDRGKALVAGITSCTDLKHLGLLGHDIGVEAFNTLVEWVKNNTVLTGLYLGDKSFDDKVLFEALKTNSHLKTLWIMESGLSLAACNSLAAWLGTSSVLERLELTKVDLKGCEALFRSLKNNTHLQRLTLHSTDIGADGMASLDALLESNVTLTEITLNYQKLQHPELLINQCLREINLAVQAVREGQRPIEDLLQSLENLSELQRTCVSEKFYLPMPYLFGKVNSLKLKLDQELVMMLLQFFPHLADQSRNHQVLSPQERNVIDVYLNFFSRLQDQGQFNLENPALKKLLESNQPHPGYRALCDLMVQASVIPSEVIVQLDFSQPVLEAVLSKLKLLQPPRLLPEVFQEILGVLNSEGTVHLEWLTQIEALSNTDAQKLRVGDIKAILETSPEDMKVGQFGLVRKHPILSLLSLGVARDAAVLEKLEQVPILIEKTLSETELKRLRPEHIRAILLNCSLQAFNEDFSNEFIGSDYEMVGSEQGSQDTRSPHFVKCAVIDAAIQDYLKRMGGLRKFFNTQNDRVTQLSQLVKQARESGQDQVSLVSMIAVYLSSRSSKITESGHMLLNILETLGYLPQNSRDWINSDAKYDRVLEFLDQFAKRNIQIDLNLLPGFFKFITDFSGPVIPQETVETAFKRSLKLFCLLVKARVLAPEDLVEKRCDPQGPGSAITDNDL